MNAINLWRLASLVLALGLVWALTRGPGTLTPEQWVEARAQDRARELAEIEAESRMRPSEDSYAYALRRNNERRNREALCKRDQ